MQIRDLNAADARIYWDLRLRSLQESPTAFGRTPEEVLSEPLEQRLARFQSEIIAPLGQNFVVGAFDETGALAGMVGFRREARMKTRHKGMVVGMYVAAEARGLGVGRQLLSELLRRARVLDGLRQLGLYVTSSNLAAKGLYTSLGFQTYGVEKDALLHDGQFLDDDLMVLFL